MAPLSFQFHPVGGCGALVLSSGYDPAKCTARRTKEFSVKVVLPASGCEIIANVRRLEIWYCMNIDVFSSVKWEPNGLLD